MDELKKKVILTLRDHDFKTESLKRIKEMLAIENKKEMERLIKERRETQRKQEKAFWDAEKARAKAFCAALGVPCRYD